MASRIFLLDAYALIFRAYYAFIRNPRVDSKGRDTSAIFGFALMLEEILEREQPEMIGVVFDPPGGTFRHREYPEYKANRDETPEGIRLAVPYIKQLLEAYRIPCIEVADFEADDVIGTLARKAEQAGLEVMMVTPDKDYGQLVSPLVKMYRPAQGGGYEVWGEAEVRERFGLQSSSQVIDYLALVGDTADNIPGCKGIGPKTAEKLLSEYPNLESILDNASNIKGATGKKLQAGAETARLSRYLATICTTVPVELEEEMLRRQPLNRAAVEMLFAELEFRSLLPKVLARNGTEGAEPSQEAPKKSSPAKAIVETPENDLFGLELFASAQVSEAMGEHQVNFEVKYLKTPEEIKTFVEQAKRAGAFAWDTETTDKDPLSAQLVAMTFALNSQESYFLDIPAKREEAIQVLALVKPLLEDDKTLKIGQNIKYDLQVVASYGIGVSLPIFDTMVAHYLLAPELRHGLDELSERYLGHIPMSFEEMIAPQTKNAFDLRQVEPSRLALYATEDAHLTWRLYELFAPKLRERDIEGLFYDIEMPLIPTLASMERAGVRLDVPVLRERSSELGRELDALEQEIYTLAGHPFNINSSRQVGEVLFDELQVEQGKIKKTKTGSYTTSVEVLEKLRDRHPIVGKILDYRGLRKLLSTYIDTLPDLLYPDGKLHSSFNQTVASTGRLSSSNPNLQNIPIRTEQGRAIREAFVPDSDECVFLSADYSQIELRLMAHFSADPALVEAFVQGEDIHRATAAKIYGLPLETVTSDMRRRAKTANFGIIYGISAFGLSERLGIPRGEAKELIEGYFRSYPQVAEYMERTKGQAKEQGYVSTLLGRRSYLKDINSANAVVRGYAERNAINAPLQGTAADIIKIAMVRLDQEIRRRGLRSRMILQVHDELNFNVYRDELEEMKTLVRETMEEAYPDLLVRLEVEVGVGPNWLEAH